MFQTWHPHAVLIEDASSGQSLIQELRSATSSPIKPVRVDRDKLSRVSSITPILEARRVLLPESAWWRDDFIAELTAFPAGAHDDWLDALTMALEYLRESNSFEGYIINLKLEIARNSIFEGLSIEEAARAPMVQLSVEEVRDYMAKRPLPRFQVRRFPWCAA